MSKRGSEEIITKSISFVEDDDPPAGPTGGKVARTDSNDPQDPRSTNTNSSSGGALYSRATWAYGEDTRIVDEEIANEDDNETEGIDENESSQEEEEDVTASNHEGVQSPDSQGSTESSIGYVDRIGQAISNGLEQLRQSMDNPILALPTNFEELFRHCLQNPAFRSRLRQFLKNDMSSQLISSGLDLESGSGLALLESVFGVKDDLLFARLGRIFVKDYPEDSSNGADPYVGESEGVDEGEIQPTFNDGVKMEPSSADTPSSSSTTTATAVVEVQNAPYSSVPDYRILTEQENQGAIPLPNQENTESAGSQYIFPEIVLKDVDWEKAFDKKKVEKMGQVLFLAVFSQEEIISCTLSGKNNTKKFCDTKLLFMNKAVAWLLMNPRERIQTAFEKDLREMELKLKVEDEDILRKNVLTEFAYQRRTQLRKAATAPQ